MAAARRFLIASIPSALRTVPWRGMSIVSHDRRQPTVPEVSKLLMRAKTLLQDKYMEPEDFQAANSLAESVATVSDDGEVEVDSEKLNALRKIVMQAIEKRSAHAEEAQQESASHIQDSKDSHPTTMASPKAPKAAPEGMCTIQ